MTPYFPCRAVRAAFALAGCVLAGSAAAAPYTLADARRDALARSAQLEGQRAVTAAARAQAISARQRPDPVLRAGIDNLPLSGPDAGSPGADFMTMRRIGVMLEWTRAAKLAARSARFEAEAAVSAAQEESLRSDVARATTAAYIELHHAREARVLAAEQLLLARDETAILAVAYRAGTATRPQWLAAQGAVASLEDRQAELSQREASARTMLERWTGQRPDALAPLPDMAEPPVTDTAAAPALAVLARRSDLAVAEAGAAAQERTPDWSVEAAYQQRGPGWPNMVSFGVSVPLQWNRAQRQDRVLAARRLQAEQARADEEEGRRAFAAEVRRQLDEWTAGRARLERYRQAIVPLADERAAALLAAYRARSATLAELLAARRDALDTRLQALQLDAVTATQWQTLRFLTAPATEGGRP